MLRKLAIAAPLFLATVAVLWSGLNLPPLLWIVKYGLTPGCEPTGRTWEIERVEFVEIGPGIARMGSGWAPDNHQWNCTSGGLLGRVVRPFALSWGEAAVPSNEMPVHWVQFPKGFALAKTQITNVQYEAFQPDHVRRSRSPGDRNPVVNVSWDDAKGYCAWLAEKSGLPVRLPSESEWEAACRAGSLAEYCFGDDEARLEEYAWYREDWRTGTCEVGTKKPNAWGFHDLHGNVWEWCEDLWHDAYRITQTVPGPPGRQRVGVVVLAPTDGSAWLLDSNSRQRVIRNCNAANEAVWFRSAKRNRDRPDNRNLGKGFRPAFTPPDR